MSTLQLPSFPNHPETATSLVSASDLNWLLDQELITEQAAIFLCPKSSICLLKLSQSFLSTYEIGGTQPCADDLL